MQTFENGPQMLGNFAFPDRCSYKRFFSFSTCEELIPGIVLCISATLCTFICILEQNLALTVFLNRYTQWQLTGEFL
jgi:hypothetical protein